MIALNPHANAQMTVIVSGSPVRINSAAPPQAQTRVTNNSRVDLPNQPFLQVILLIIFSALELI
jgi:hypothetical protein